MVFAQLHGLIAAHSRIWTRLLPAEEAVLSDILSEACITLEQHSLHGPRQSWRCRRLPFMKALTSVRLAPSVRNLKLVSAMTSERRSVVGEAACVLNPAGGRAPGVRRREAGADAATGVFDWLGLSGDCWQEAPGQRLL